VPVHEAEYIDLVLPDNTTSWKQGWFYLDNPTPVLPTMSGRALVPFLEWTNLLTSRETKELRPFLEDLGRLKVEGLTDGAVAISFSRQLLQPIQDWVDSTYEYWGQSDPTRVVRRKVSKEKIVVRVKNIFTGRIHN
jgi:diphthamide synthase (EF-2-diphthine--ammonia ligase)